MYMNREEINNHIKIITPNLIKFANVITQDGLRKIEEYQGLEEGQLKCVQEIK